MSTGQRGHLMSDELARHIARDWTAPRDQTIACECCGAPFVPGAWCFYGLCDPCFARFAEQRGEGRVSRLLHGQLTPYFESSEAWIAHERARAGKVVPGQTP